MQGIRQKKECEELKFEKLQKINLNIVSCFFGEKVSF